MARRGTRTAAGKQRTLHEAGYSGDGRNMRGRTNVPCRIINDWAGAHHKDGSEFRYPVLETLSAWDDRDPEHSGLMLPPPPVTGGPFDGGWQRTA